MNATPEISESRFRPLWSANTAVKLCTILALIFVVRFWTGGGRDPADSSPLDFLDPLRAVIFLIGLFANDIYRLRERIKLSPRQAIIAFLALSWIAGMMFELGLSEEGDGSRQMILLTMPYFVTIQGAYVSMTVMAFLLIRYLHCNLKEVFFAGALTCLWEVLAFGVPMLRTAGLISGIILIAYYMVAYSLILAWPLIFLNEKLLWDTRDAKYPSVVKVALGIPIGILSMLIFGGWGVVFNKMFY